MEPERDVRLDRGASSRLVEGGQGVQVALDHTGPVGLPGGCGVGLDVDVDPAEQPARQGGPQPVVDDPARVVHPAGVPAQGVHADSGGAGPLADLADLRQEWGAVSRGGTATKSCPTPEAAARSTVAAGVETSQTHIDLAEAAVSARAGLPAAPTPTEATRASRSMSVTLASSRAPSGARWSTARVPSRKPRQCDKAVTAAPGPGQVFTFRSGSGGSPAAGRMGP